MAKLVRQEGDHNVMVVEDGDTLWSISKELLGDGKRWGELATSNPTGDQLAQHAYVRAGTEIKVPKDFQPSGL